MSTQRPPTLDPIAAQRWADTLPGASPWLHEEVARRMEERLQWIAKAPQHWAHWQPLQGGRQAQALIARRYPKAACFVLESRAENVREARKLIAKPWWNPAGWSAPAVHFEAPAAPVDMLWSNMALHMAAEPEALIAHWHSLVAVDGFLMFSCFGPDTLRELRAVYAAQGWPAPSHEFTDMHDWGDMLVHAGFAEPVMDMERITLSFSSPDKLLQELRGLGRNLGVQRFAGLRGRGWRDRLHAALAQRLANPGEQGRLTLTFEVIYGHAFKPPARLKVQPETSVSLDAMRQQLRGASRAPAGPDGRGFPG